MMEWEEGEKRIKNGENNKYFNCTLLRVILNIYYFFADNSFLKDTYYKGRKEE